MEVKKAVFGVLRELLAAQTRLDAHLSAIIPHLISSATDQTESDVRLKTDSLSLLGFIVSQHASNPASLAPFLDNVVKAAITSCKHSVSVYV